MRDIEEATCNRTLDHVGYGPGQVDVQPWPFVLTRISLRRVPFSINIVNTPFSVKKISSEIE